MGLLGQENLHRVSHQMRSYLGVLKRNKLDVAGQVWRYLEGGSRGQDTIVFVHGMGGTKTQWRSLMDIFSAEYRVIALDMPGLFNGLESTTGDGFDCLAHSLEAFFSALGLSRFHLFGHSLGANVCAVFAGIYPKRLLSLTLCSVVAIENDQGPGELSRFAAFRQKMMFKDVEEFSQLAEVMFYNPPKAPDFLMRYSMNEMIKYRRMHVRVLTAFDQTAHLVRESLEKVSCPCLVIGGANDLLLSNSCVQVLHNILQDAEFVQIPQCAHMPYLEKPRALADHFRCFLHKRSKPAGAIA